MTGIWRSLFVSAALVWSLCLLPVTGYAGEAARTVHSTTLRDAPSTSGKPLGSLPGDTELLVLDRQAGWVQINAKGRQGWLPEQHIKTNFTFKQSATAPRNGFLSWFTAALKTDSARVGVGSSAVNRVNTATIGIRGLANDGAIAAKSNSEELQKLKLYSVSRLDAEEFGRSALLVPNNVAYTD